MTERVDKRKVGNERERERSEKEGKLERGLKRAV